MIDDALDRIATLITDIGRCYESARRYRDLGEISERRFLDRTLDIGADVRAAARRGTLDAATIHATVEELETLATECRRAIAAIRASAAYGDALAAWEREDWRRVADLVPAIFASVEPVAAGTRAYYGVPLAAGRRSREHFVPAAECATVIERVMHDGISAPDEPPDLGADERLRAVVLGDDPDAVESPVMLAIDVATLPLWRVVPAGTLLTHRPRLVAPMRVQFADRVTDEWWAVRPDAYRGYVEELTATLAARGIPVESRAPAA